MATNPSRHPLDEEIAELYAAYPELKDELDEMERELEANQGMLSTPQCNSSAS